MIVQCQNCKSIYRVIIERLHYKDEAGEIYCKICGNVLYRHGANEQVNVTLIEQG